MLKASPRQFDQHIGQRVKMRRLMLGMSQEKLADGLGLTFQQVQKYERGANRIGGSRMQQIATVLQVQPAYFFDGLPGSPSPITVETDLAQTLLSSRQGVALARAFLDIASQDVRAAIVAMAQASATEPHSRAAA